MTLVLVHKPKHYNFDLLSVCIIFHDNPHKNLLRYFTLEQSEKSGYLADRQANTTPVWLKSQPYAHKNTYKNRHKPPVI